MQQLSWLIKGDYDAVLLNLYGEDALPEAKKRYEELLRSFSLCFGSQGEVQLFSAPGRTEVGGNHTDHQQGCVLAAAVDLDVIAAVRIREDGRIRVQSKGFPQMDEVDTARLQVQDQERETSSALIRGVCMGLKQRGYRIGGFEAYTMSNVLKGSGLSSSAAFEVLLVTILNHLYNGGAVSATEAAQIAQYAENEYFGKPSGLMDQMASAQGGCVFLDFGNCKQPVVEPIGLDLCKEQYALCIVDTGGSHANLTSDYASIPTEMKRVAQALGFETLRACSEQTLLQALPSLRTSCGDRPVLRALHFVTENHRVLLQKQALLEGNFTRFLQLVTQSGRSSFEYLQNVYSPAHPQEQGLALALCLSERLLEGEGAFRVHGGGFAGTIQAYVPLHRLPLYRVEMERVFGEGSCHVLHIRGQGGVCVRAVD